MEIIKLNMNGNHLIKYEMELRRYVNKNNNNKTCFVLQL